MKKNFRFRPFFVNLITLVLCSVLLVSPQAVGAVCISEGFDVITVDPAQEGAWTVVPGDFNGDGFTDLAAGVSGLDKGVVVYLNDGEGGHSKTDYLEGNSTRSLEVFDFDGDEDLDMVSAGYDSSGIFVLINDGEGVFSTLRVDSPMPGFGFVAAEAVKPVDLDGDMDIDFLAVSAFDKVSWYENVGEGDFSQSVITTDFFGPTDIAAYDFDDDGDMDFVATANIFGGPEAGVGLWLNDGSELFSYTQLDGTLSDSVFIEDINGDSNVDVVAAAGSFGANTIKYYLGDGEGSFGAPTTIVPADGAVNPNDVAVGDFEGDGDMDIVASAASGIGIFANGGELNFSESAPRIGTLIPDMQIGFYEDDEGLDLFFADNTLGLVMVANQTCMDATAPEIETLSPADDAVDVAEDTDLIITFDENIEFGAGTISVYATEGDLLFESVDVETEDDQIATDGGEVIIDLDETLDSSTAYYVQIDEGAFVDEAANDFAGIDDETTWNFTTGDSVAPTVETLSPIDNAGDVAIDTDLLITFDEVVEVGDGNVTVYAGIDTLVEAVDVTSLQVTGDGTDTITITLTDDLDYETAYYVLINEGAFVDEADNDFGGIFDPEVWSFTTVADEEENNASGGGGSSSKRSNTKKADDRTNESEANNESGSEDSQESDSEPTITRDVVILDEAVKKVQTKVVELDEPTEEEKQNLPFEDVKDHWAVDVITKLHKAGIVSGSAEGAMEPDRNIYRAEILKVAFEVFGIEVDEVEEGQKWYENYVKKAEELRIMTKGEPEREVTRAEALQIILRSAAVIVTESDKSRFRDLSPTDWYVGLVNFAAEMGVIEGYEDKSFRPNQPITRAEAFAIAVRVYEFFKK